MYQRILVPVDGSPTSHAGLAEAIELARLTGGRLRLVHVVDEMPSPRATVRCRPMCWRCSRSRATAS
jgi:nucleotide-binding universal stress UspA family protein